MSDERKRERAARDEHDAAPAPEYVWLVRAVYHDDERGTYYGPWYVHSEDDAAHAKAAGWDVRKVALPDADE